jgi:hypothetical protein
MLQLSSAGAPPSNLTTHLHVFQLEIQRPLQALDSQLRLALRRVQSRLEVQEEDAVGVSKA